MELRPASQFSLPELTRIWNLGYNGYFVPITFTEAQLEGHLKPGHVDLDRSVVLMDGDAPAGFSFLGLRGERGWIGGFGITPDYRGKGLAYSLFADHMAQIRESGLPAVQLEVLVENWARKVYERAGFRVTRRLSILQGRLPVGNLAEADVAEENPRALLAHSERLHGEWAPCWQREAAHQAGGMHPEARCIITGDAAAPTGFLIYVSNGESVRIGDAAACSAEEAVRLVSGLAAAHPGQPVVVVNEPEGSPIHQALTAVGCTEVRAQYEMHWSGR